MKMCMIYLFLKRNVKITSVIYSSLLIELWWKRKHFCHDWCRHELILCILFLIWKRANTSFFFLKVIDKRRKQIKRKGKGNEKCENQQGGRKMERNWRKISKFLFLYIYFFLFEEGIRLEEMRTKKKKEINENKTKEK